MDIHAIISSTRAALYDSFHTVDLWFDKDPDLRKYKPANGGWSIDEVLEHITLTNHFLLILISKAARKAKDNIHHLNLQEVLAHYRFDKDTLDEVGIYQSFYWIRPEHMEPTGTKCLEEIRAVLSRQLAECMGTLDLLPEGEGVLDKTTMTVNNLGKIDVYQYLYFLAKHAERHVEQMKRVEKEYWGSIQP